MGLTDCALITFTTQATSPIWLQQYPHKPAAEEGIAETILSTPTVPVPNPYVALTNLSPSHKWFTCIDLANAFFCLPLAEECRDIFSFTYKGQQWRYTRLHTSSPCLLAFLTLFSNKLWTGATYLPTLCSFSTLMT